MLKLPEAWRIVRDSTFARTVGGLMALTALGQAIYLVSAPILGRLYSPEAFGKYGLFYTFIVTAALFPTLNYDLAIPAALRDRDARRLALLSQALATVIAPLLGLIYLMLIVWGVGGFDVLPAWSTLAVVAVVYVQAMVQIMQAWRIRSQRTIAIGQSSISLNVIRGGSQVLLGLLGGAWWALSFGELAGRFAAYVHLKRASPWRPRRLRDLVWFSRSTALRYRQFPLVMLPAQAVDGFVVLGQIAALTALFGAGGMGQYFLMRRTLDLPVAFAFRSLGDVFYARMAAYVRLSPRRVKPFYIRSCLALVGLGAIGAAPLMVFGPEMFRLVFGPAWGEAGRLAAVMAPSAVLNLAVAPASRVFALTRRPSLRYVFTIFQAVGTGVVVLVGWKWEWDLVELTAALSAVISLSYLAYFFAGVAATDALIHEEASPSRDTDGPPARKSNASAGGGVSRSETEESTCINTAR